MAEEWKPLNPPAPPEPPPAAVDPGPHRWRQTFRGVPVRTPAGPGPLGLTADLADDLATHIERAGYVHVDEVAALLAEAGLPELEALPRQTRYQHPPEHGLDTWMNPPQWVDEEETA